MKKMQKKYEAIDFPNLNNDQISMLEKLEKLSDNKIDVSDIPEAKGCGGFYYKQLDKKEKRISTQVLMLIF